MFEQGSTLRVKIEASAGKVGFGRATIVKKEANKLYMHLATGLDTAQHLPQGARVWFIDDHVSRPAPGTWATQVTGAKIVAGQTLVECPMPKFEPLQQKRKFQRYAFSNAVMLNGSSNVELRSRNISKSGIALEVQGQADHVFKVGDSISITIESKVGDITIGCLVIRVHSNWLANRTDIGLEFKDIQGKNQELLNQLIDLLEQSSGNADSPDQEIESGKTLSLQLKARPYNPELVRRPAPEPEAE